MAIVIRLEDRCYDCPCPEIKVTKDECDRTVVDCANHLVCHKNLTYLYERIMRGDERDPDRC